MLRITPRSAAPYKEQVCAFVRAHGLSPDDCKAVILNLPKRAATFQLLDRDQDGRFFLRGGDVAQYEIEKPLAFPPPLEWCEAH